MWFFQVFSERGDTSFLDVVRDHERCGRFLGRQRQRRSINFILGAALFLLGLGLMLVNDASVNTALALLGVLQIAIALYRDLCIKLVMLMCSDPSKRGVSA